MDKTLSLVGRHRISGQAQTDLYESIAGLLNRLGAVLVPQQDAGAGT